MQPSFCLANGIFGAMTLRGNPNELIVVNAFVSWGSYIYTKAFNAAVCKPERSVVKRNIIPCVISVPNPLPNQVPTILYKQ